MTTFDLLFSSSAASIGSELSSLGKGPLVPCARIIMQNTIRLHTIAFPESYEVTEL